MCPESAERKSIEGSGESGRVMRLYFKGGHPALPDGLEGLVKVTALSVVESGAKTMGVGVMRLHGCDLCDMNTCTVLLHFMSDDSLVVSDAPAVRAWSALVCSVCVKRVQ